jgi:hypothetical protein
MENRRFDWGLLGVASVAYSILFAYFYPPLSGIEDEIGFRVMADVWSRGHFTSEGAGLAEPPQGFIPSRNLQGHVGWQNPGRPLTLLPFLWLGIKPLQFWSGALVHLITSWLAAALLVRLGRSPAWAILILFHPTLAIYSRTIMADQWGGLCLIGAVSLGLWRGRPFMGALLAGLAAGTAVLFRFQSCVLLPFLAIAVGLTDPCDEAATGLFHKSRLIRVLLFTASASIPAGGLLAYHQFVYDRLTGGLTGAGLFGWQHLYGQLAFYVPALSLIWPLMLVAPALDRGPMRWLAPAVCVPSLGLLLLYYWHDTGSGWIQTMVLGQRLLQAALPIWIVSYACALGGWSDKLALLRAAAGSNLRITVVSIGALVLISGTTMIFARHQAHLEEFRIVRDILHKSIPEGSLVVLNSTTAKLMRAAPFEQRVRVRIYTYAGRAIDHSEELKGTSGWYLAILPKQPGDELPDVLAEYERKYQLERIPTEHPGLILYRAP